MLNADEPRMSTQKVWASFKKKRRRYDREDLLDWIMAIDVYHKLS